MLIGSFLFILGQLKLSCRVNKEKAITEPMHLESITNYDIEEIEFESLIGDRSDQL
jgi:hypothetical protein